MARKKQVRSYVRHRERTEWGTGLLVHAGPIESTYVFADGARRVFKAADRARFLEDTAPPEPEVRERLERGFASGGASTPRAMHLDFVAQLRANRRDTGVYLAYADWLQGQKDPRGELIVIQHQLAQKPRDQKLHAAQRELMTRHADYFLPRSVRKILDANTGCTAIWRYGFLTHVRLARRPRDDHDPADVLPDLLAHPSAELLESLSIGPVGVRDSPHFLPCIQAIARTGHALLEELIVDAGNSRRSRIGNIVPLFSALPSLQRLSLTGHSVRVGTQTKHERLRSITISVDEATLAGVLRGKLPALETLELDVPDLHVEPAEISMLLDGKRMPKLQRLALRGTTQTAAILDAILKSAHLPHLAELVLADGDMAPRAMELARLKQKLLAHLRVLEVTGEARVDPLERRRMEQAAVAQTRAQSARREWTTLARDGEIIWGERDGEATFVRLGTTHSGCSCAGERRPCAHVTSLLALSAVWPTLEEREVPDEMMQRVRRV